jgi:type I restriction enzyme S subunit
LEWVTSAGHGTGVLETDRLKSIRIPIVQRSEQVRIAQTFAAIDDKIELNRRMNETLEAMAQAIFRDWFVDFGPTRRKLEGATDPVTIMGGLVQDADRAEAIADFFPSAIGNDDLPDSWRTRIIYDCCDVKYGAPFASDRFNTVKNGRPLARIRDLPGNVGGVYTDEVHPKEHQIAAGDIVVGMDGEFRAYLWHGEPTLMNQRVCSFVPKPNRSRAFLLFSLRPLLATCEATAVGTTVIHLGKKDIDRFNVVAAPEDLEASFASIVEPMLDLVVSNGAQNRTLAATRDLLLPKLMSGEIRLREAEEMLEAAQ